MAREKLENQDSNKQMEVDIKLSEDKVEDQSELIKQLMDAAKNGKIEKVKYLIEEKTVDVNSADDTKAHNTALHHAAEHGQDIIIEYLIDSGAQKDVQDAMFGMTPLYLAVDYNQENAVKKLLYYGANCNIPSKNDITPLHSAAQENNFNITKELKDEIDKTLQTQKENPSEKAWEFRYLLDKIKAKSVERG